MLCNLQAFKNHEIVDIFQEPGNCDITANVDFAYLRESMEDIGGFVVLILLQRLTDMSISDTVGSDISRIFPHKNGIGVEIADVTSSCGNRGTTKVDPWRRNEADRS